MEEKRMYPATNSHSTCLCLRK